jgi:glutamate-1-semialdehyde 2,1-aminomutase
LTKLCLFVVQLPERCHRQPTLWLIYQEREMGRLSLQDSTTADSEPIELNEPLDPVLIRTSAALFERAQSIFPGGVNSPVRSFRAVGSKPFVVSRASGAWIYDVDGRRYVDYTCSWGAILAGHANDEVSEAIATQARNGVSYGACAEIETSFAEFLKTNQPYLEMLRFVNSGTEATLACLRLARAHTGREKVLKFSGCSHGQVDSLYVQSANSATTFGLPACPGVTRSITHETLSAPYNDIAAARSLFATFPKEIAAIIVEPAVSSSSLLLGSPAWIAALRELATEYGAVLIFDESSVGFRIHPQGASGVFGVEPDLLILGRAAGGGVPAGAFGGRREIMSLLAPLGPVLQNGTLAGNPLAMAAGLTSLRHWILMGGFDVASRYASLLTSAINTFAAEYRVPLIAHCLGSMFGIHFGSRLPQNCEDAKGSNVESFRRLFHLMLERGVYLPPSPTDALYTSAAHGGEPVDHTISAFSYAIQRLGSGSYRR